MLHPCEDDAVVPLPATRLRRRLRHALHGPLAGMGVGGVPGGTEWGILERSQLSRTQRCREHWLSDLLS